MKQYQRRQQQQQRTGKSHQKERSVREQILAWHIYIYSVGVELLQCTHS